MSQSQVVIYLRSSPLGDVGIHWRNISKDEQPIEEPDILKQRVIKRNDGKQQVTINSLINETKPSLILAEYHGKIILEVTGLDASEARSERMGRRISEVVLWVGDASSKEVEPKLRQLAACALLSFWSKERTFATTIRNAVYFDGLNSFKVNADEIKQLYDDADKNLDSDLSVSPSSETDSPNLVWSTLLEINSEKQLHALARQISQISQTQTLLLDGEQPVVVVAELKRNNDDQQIIYSRNAVLSHEPVDEQTVTAPQDKLETESQKKTSILSQTTASRPADRIAIFVIILLVVTFATVVIQTTQPQIPSPPPTLSPTPAPTPTPETEQGSTPQPSPVLPSSIAKRLTNNTSIDITQCTKQFT